MKISWFQIQVILQDLFGSFLDLEKQAEIYPSKEMKWEQVHKARLLLLSIDGVITKEKLKKKKSFLGRLKGFLKHKVTNDLDLL